MYSDPNLFSTYFLGYDPSGNLYVDGTNAYDQYSLRRNCRRAAPPSSTSRSTQYPHSLETCSGMESISRLAIKDRPSIKRRDPPS